MLKLPLFGGEQKCALWCVPSNANELLLPAPFQGEGGALRALWQQNRTISHVETVSSV